MASEIDKIETNIADTAASNKEEPLESRQDSKSAVLTSILKDPEILQAIAMVVANIQNTQNKEKEDESIKLDARKRIEAEDKRTKMEDANNALSGDWYNKRCEIDKLPFGVNREKEVVNEELEKILQGVDNKTISYMEACDLLNTAVVQEELDIDDERLKLDPKYSAIKDLCRKSNVKNRYIVNPDILNYAFDQTKIQMQLRASERSSEQRREHADFNSSYVRGSPVSIDDYSFGDLVNMSIIGASRINPMLENATKEQYQKVYSKQFDKFKRDTKNQAPKIVNY